MKVQFLEKSSRVKLLEDECVPCGDVIYVIPQGFTFDGASIPSFLSSVLFLHPLHYKVRRAGMLHDYLYKRGDRAVADAIFRKILKDDGANFIQRNLMFWGVRVFGWISYKKK